MKHVKIVATPRLDQPKKISVVANVVVVVNLLAKRVAQ